MKRALLAFASLCFCAALTAQDSEIRIRLVETAKKYLGTPYIYGAESPQAFDCSGFVRYVYRLVTGLELERSSRGIFATGRNIDSADAKPGDVFVYDTVGGRPSHVAMFIGDGKIIHAVSEGPHTGVIISMQNDSYFGPKVIGTRVFLTTGSAVASAPPAAKPAPVKPAPADKSTAQKPAVPAAKPTAQETAPSPQTAKADKNSVVDIDFTIPPEKTVYTDKVPALVGTSISFTAKNGTGKEGTFIVIFYKTNKNFSASRELRKEKITLSKNGVFEIPPYAFVEEGVYKLIVKDNWGNQLFERIFTVGSPK